MAKKYILAFPKSIKSLFLINLAIINKMVRNLAKSKGYLKCQKHPLQNETARLFISPSRVGKV